MRVFHSEDHLISRLERLSNFSVLKFTSNLSKQSSFTILVVAKKSPAVIIYDIILLITNVKS